MEQKDEKVNFASPGMIVWRRFRKDKIALVGLCGIVFLFAVAVFAPFIANGRPLVLFRDGFLSFPALRYVFAPDTSEVIVEKIFNYILIFILPACLLFTVFREKSRLKLGALAIWAAIAVIPFVLVGPKLEKSDWRRDCAHLAKGEFAVFAAVPYGPFENVGEPHLKPCRDHVFGTDQIGRDVLSRMVYGARVSLAVGLLATTLTLIFGIIVGLFCGYFGGRTDFIVMRIVEIIMCFPTFLLLLILMAIMMDRKMEQSILLVIAVIGLTSWTGLRP
jgi:peptide/nickel transport system permease protein